MSHESWIYEVSDSSFIMSAARWWTSAVTETLPAFLACLTLDDFDTFYKKCRKREKDGIIHSFICSLYHSHCKQYSKPLSYVICVVACMHTDTRTSLVEPAFDEDFFLIDISAPAIFLWSISWSCVRKSTYSVIPSPSAINYENIIIYAFFASYTINICI